jgi:hypothetical protein
MDILQCIASQTTINDMYNGYRLKKAKLFNSFFLNRTLSLKETPNSTKYPKKNENYTEQLIYLTYLGISLAEVT